VGEKKFSRKIIFGKRKREINTVKWLLLLMVVLGEDLNDTNMAWVESM